MKRKATATTSSSKKDKPTTSSSKRSLSKVDKTSKPTTKKSTAVEPPAKKQKLLNSNDENSVKVGVKTLSDSTEAPLLVTYPTGATALRDTSLLQFQNKTNPSTFSLYGETDAMTLFAKQSFDGESLTRRGNNFAIGVYDPDTKQVELMPIEKVYGLKQTLTAPTKKAIIPSDRSQLMFKPAFSRNVEVRANKLFGKQVVNQSLRIIKNRAFMKRKNARDFDYPKFLPSQDLTTSDPASVYQIRPQIIDSQAAKLVDTSIILSNSKSKNLPPLLMAAIAKDPEFFSNESKVLMATYLVHLLWLMSFEVPTPVDGFPDNVSFTKNHRTLKPIMWMPENAKLRSSMVERYFTRSRRRWALNKQNYALLRSHAIILTGAVNGDYTVDLKLFHRTTMTPSNEVAQLLLVLKFGDIDGSKNVYKLLHQLKKRAPSRIAEQKEEERLAKEKSNKKVMVDDDDDDDDE